MTGLERIAAFVRRSEMGTVSRTQRDVLRLHAADAAVALLAGARAPEGAHLRALPRLAREDIDRAGLAAAIIRSTEADDIHIASCVTPTSVALPAALLADGTAEDAENALRIGVELAVRLGLAIDGSTCLYRGVWPTCFAVPFAVAAVLSRLRGLDEERIAHALSLALMMSSGRGGRFAGEPTGRWLLLMVAFTDGARAVEAAECGYKGDPSLLEGPWLKNAVGGEPVLGLLLENLDRSTVIDGLGMKPFSTARQALAPTQALADLVAEGLDPATIEDIEVRAPPAYAAMISRPLEPHRSSGYVNAGFQMALAALAPDHLVDLDRSTVMRDPALLAFAARVRVVADPALQAEYPARWPAELAVTAAGKILRRRVDAPRGDATARLTRADVVLKAQMLLAPHMSAQEAERTFELFATAFQSPRCTASAVTRLREALA